MDVNENAKNEGAAIPERELRGFVNAGLSYVDRYGGPRARVERALLRRARRRELAPEAAARVVAAAMAKIDGFGVVDDRAFAESKARGLRGRGASRRSALAKLQATGIAPDLAEAALEAVDGAEAEDADQERAAAERYARRRRLGPWRTDPATRAGRRDRDVAALARAGFPPGLALAVFDGPGA
ncbi:MAG: RecX family transcriptional regulator, partial [Alphaproteobacteria bacterium]